jgi:hypothetical protein
MSKSNALLISLHGIDSRLSKTITLFLQGPCGGIGRIAINHEVADIDMFDGDQTGSKKLLEQHLQENIVKPVIVLSLQDIEQKDGVLHLKKPVVTADMLNVLENAKKLMSKLRNKESKLKKILKGVPNQFSQAPQQALTDIDQFVTTQKAPADTVHGNQTANQPTAKQPTGDDTLDQLDDWFASGL